MKMRMSYTSIPDPAPILVGEVTLTMSWEDAKALRAITGHITGGGVLRAATDRIFDALSEVPGLGVSFDRPFKNGSPMLRKEFQL